MDKHVCITGASGGIGAACAVLFAQNGCRVTLGYHTRKGSAEACQNNIAATGAEAQALVVDVADEAGVEQFFTQAEAGFGAVDILVNAAGHAQQLLFTDITLADWQRMMDTHATGSFLCCKRALPAMIRKKSGVIVNIASMWGQVGASCEVHYSAAKAAVIGLTRALAKEVAPSGIRVNCVAPGAIDTPMLDGLDGEGRGLLCEEIPLGRIGTAQEAAQAVFFLASPAAAYFTGQVLSPNGGLVV